MALQESLPSKIEVMVDDGQGPAVTDLKAVLVVGGAQIQTKVVDS